MRGSDQEGDGERASQFQIYCIMDFPISYIEGRERARQQFYISS